MVRRQAVAFALAVAAATGGCSGPASPPDAGTRPLNHAPEVAYVGQEACRRCHLEQFGTSTRTGMGRAFYPLTPKEIVETFSPPSEFVVQPSGLRYRMLERDGRYYQRQFLLDAAGREVAVDERELSYVIGSNNHSRSYVTLVDGRWFQAPACWYPGAQQFELCPGYEFKNDHFARQLEMACLHCHNGKMETIAGRRNQYREPYPHGLGCERCHGPGQLHVERWTAGQDTPTGAADPTIVHPRRLPPRERAQICFQCHLGDSKVTERVSRPGRDITGYRPGMELTEFLVPFRYRQQVRSEFGLSAQADRMLLSACYTESAGKLECLTCHDPHVSVYHPDRPADAFRLACLSCHAEAACTAAPAERQATPQLPDDCVACHMRRAEPDDQRFTEFTDHWIRRDVRAEPPDHRESYDVEPVFPESFARLTPAEQSFYRARAQALLARDAPARLRQPIWAAAERDYLESIRLGFDNADAWFFLSKIRRHMGARPAAHEALERAFARDRHHYDSAYAWGQALAQQGDPRAALAVFEDLLLRNPDDPMALAEAGRMLTLLGRPQETLSYLERAIRAEPWTAILRANACRTLAALGRFEEAAAMSLEAVRLNPDSPEMWELYEKTHEALGRQAEAAEGRRQRDIMSRIPKLDRLDAGDL